MASKRWNPFYKSDVWEKTYLKSGRIFWDIALA
jgi:hypothetical protein